MSRVFNNLLIIYNNLLIYLVYLVMSNNPNIKVSYKLSNVTLIYCVLMAALTNFLGFYLIEQTDSIVIRKIETALVSCLFVNVVDFVLGLFWHCYSYIKYQNSLINQNIKISDWDNEFTNKDNKNQYYDYGEEVDGEEVDGENKDEDEVGEEEDDEEEDVDDADIQDNIDDEDIDNGDIDNEDEQSESSLPELIPIENENNLTPLSTSSDCMFKDKNLSEQCANEIRAILSDTDERTIRLVIRTINRHLNK